jgi:hypothetical protein
VVDERLGVGERNELAVVEQATDEARVVVTSLLAVGHHVDARAELRGDREPRGVLGRRRELVVREAPVYRNVSKDKSDVRMIWP